MVVIARFWLCVSRVLLPYIKQVLNGPKMTDPTVNDLPKDMMIDISIMEKYIQSLKGSTLDRLHDIKGWRMTWKDVDYVEIFTDYIYDYNFEQDALSLHILFAINLLDCTFDIGFGKDDGKGLDYRHRFVSSKDSNKSVNGLFELVAEGRQSDKTSGLTLSQLYRTYPDAKNKLIENLNELVRFFLFSNSTC